MTRVLSPGVVTDDVPEDTSKPVASTQWPGKQFVACDPAAIHDRYPPVGSGKPPFVVEPLPPAPPFTWPWQ